MNKLTKQTVYVPCGSQVTHFKVKCDPDDEGNYMQCNVKKEENKYILSEEELIEFGSNFFRQGERYGRYDIREIEIGEKNLTLDLPEYIKEILNNE